MANVLVSPFHPAQTTSVSTAVSATPMAPAGGAPVADPNVMPPSHERPAEQIAPPSISDFVHNPTIEVPAVEEEAAPEAEALVAGDDAAQPDIFADDDAEPAVDPRVHRTNEDRAARRVAAAEAEKLRVENEELRKNVITDADVEEYRRVRADAEQGRAAVMRNKYNEAYAQAVTRAVQAGTEVPAYDEGQRDEWVARALQSQQKPLTARDVEGVVERVVTRVQQKSRQEFDGFQQATAAKTREDNFKATLKDAVDKKELPTAIARNIYRAAKAEGFKTDPKQEIAAVTGTRKKVEKLVAGNRAAAARAALPLKGNGGSREPARSGQSRTQYIEEHGLGVAELIAAHEAGRLPPK